MLRKIMTTVDFEFEVDLNKKPEEIRRCIREQIVMDGNAYYQNDDDTAQLKQIQIRNWGI